MIHKLKWWGARLLMKLTGAKHCGGEGHYRDADDELVVCYKRGCH